MDRLLHDLRHAARSLRRSPGFTAVAVLTLALGIGASTAIYTMIERVVLDPLPYPEPERLVRLTSPVPGVAPDEEWQLSAAEYFHFGERARTIVEIGAYQRSGANVRTPEGPQRVHTAAVTASMLRLLGARPALGRILDERDDDPGAAPVAVLSHGFWQRQFGGDPQVVGRTLSINESPVEVVGVMEPGVELPQERGAPFSTPTGVWLAYPLDPDGPFYNNHVIRVAARLGPGATLEQAQTELDHLTAELPERFPQVYSTGFFERYGFSTRAYPLDEYIVGDVAGHLWVLLGAVGLVLLIACANVANLLLVRVEGRRREIAVRSALGADRGAIARHILAESLVLATAGGVLALLLGVWGVEGLVSLAPTTIPRLDDVDLDGSIALFALGLSVAVALALALLPVVRYARTAGAGALAEGGRSATVGRERQRARSALIVVQVALALVLVVGAGLLLESFRRLRAVDPGVEPAGVLTMQLHLPPARYESMDDEWRFYSAVSERIRALPGVTAVGVSAALPFTGAYGCTVQGFEDAAVLERLSGSDGTTCAGQSPTSPGYFEALGIPVLRGRTFTDADNAAPERGAVVVSRAFAERFWPGEDPIGKGVAPAGRFEPPFYRVVGVVGDVYSSSVEEAPAVAIYYPIVPIPETSRWWPGGMSLVVRAARDDPASLFPEIRRVVAEVDPDVPLANVEEMTAIVERSMGRLSFLMVLLGVAAAVALLLAAVGLYGVVSYVVARRTGEIGVRMALGARPRQVERMVVRSSAGLVALGMGCGLAAALALTRLMRSLLYGVPPTHPAAYLAAAAVLAAVAGAASWIPARRAARVDPMVALRAE